MWLLPIGCFYYTGEATLGMLCGGWWRPCGWNISKWVTYFNIGLPSSLKTCSYIWSGVESHSTWQAVLLISRVAAWTGMVSLENKKVQDKNAGGGGFSCRLPKIQDYKTYFAAEWLLIPSAGLLVCSAFRKSLKPSRCNRWSYKHPMVIATPGSLWWL